LSPDIERGDKMRGVLAGLVGLCLASSAIADSVCDKWEFGEPEELKKCRAEQAAAAKFLKQFPPSLSLTRCMHGAEVGVEDLTVAVRCLKGLENCQKVGVRPTIGMTYEQAVATCWGKPETINRTITQGHVRVQAVYADHQHYLYFDDGVLTSIGESGAAP
jgi:hypothetical protein